MLEDYGWNNPYPEIKTDITEEIDELPGEGQMILMKQVLKHMKVIVN